MSMDAVTKICRSGMKRIFRDNGIQRCFRGRSQANDDPVISCETDFGLKNNRESRITKIFRCMGRLINRCNKWETGSLRRRDGRVCGIELENIETGSEPLNDGLDSGYMYEISIRNKFRRFGLPPPEPIRTGFAPGDEVNDNESGESSAALFSTGVSDHLNSPFPAEYDYNFYAKLFNDFASEEQNWVNDIGPGNTIPPTFHVSQKLNMTDPEVDIMIQQTPRDAILHITDKGVPDREVLKDSTRSDTMHISSSTTPDAVDNKRTSKISFSLEVLQRHFKMSIDDAARSLDVSRSTLKRICRLNGIERWPNRPKRKPINHEKSENPEKVNKLDKVNSKNPTNQSTSTRTLIADTCGEASSNTVTIRATYGDDIVKFPFSISCELDDLKKETCKWLGKNILIKLKCKDEDGDLVLIACDDALHRIFGNRLRLADHSTIFDFTILPDTN